MAIETAYPGHGFHQQFKNGRSSGELVVTGADIRFRNDQASVSFSIHGAEVSLGGASDRLIFITHPSQPDWKLYTTDRSILNNPHLQQNPQIQQQMKKAKQRNIFNWSVFAAVVAVIVMVPLSLVMGMDRISAIIAHHIPLEWEQKMGEQVFNQYKANGHFMPEKRAKKLMQPLVKPLLDALPEKRFNYQFYVSRDDEVNAFALPGGYVVVNSGLILKAETPEELLGVLAHEISHVTEQHGIRNIIGTAGIYLTVNALLGDMSGLLATIANAAPFLINQSYSRKFETEADEKGVALLERARIDPRGLETFFAKLLKEEQRKLKETVGEDNQDLAKTTLGFLSTHPATEDRIADLKKLIGEQPHERYRDLDEAFLHLQDAVKEYVTSQDEEEE